MHVYSDCSLYTCTDPTEQILQAALQEGYIPHRDDKFLIHGQGGVGKSSLIAMFLGTQRDLIRISTPVATTKPLHLAPTQDVSISKFTADWQRVNYERLSHMIAPLSGRLRFAISEVFKNFLTTSLGDDPCNIKELFHEFQQGLRGLILESTQLNELIMSYSIRLVDSAGQPQFHDIVSIFIPEPSGLVSVFKLNEYLDSYGEVAYYEDGTPTNDPYTSHYTNEQVIRHDLQIIQSEATRCGIEPSLAFVGTFLDERDSCPETPDKKDERLHAIITEMLPKNMQERVITSGGLKHVTFRVNAQIPGNQDFKKVDQLKESLMTKSQTKCRNLPLKWYSYDVALHMLMEELQRCALSRKECEFIGYKLGFDHASLNAALSYLHQLNIIAYYDVLPNVILGSSQMILDKITELVCYSLKLKKRQQALSEAERKFVQQGILSIQFLRSPDLGKHYTPELFQPEDLLKVLISHLVVSPVGMKEFIMPCVLEVSTIYPSPPVPEGSVHSSFILHFSKKSPMFGIYCCTISSLLSDAGWKLLTDDGEVMQVARNSFTFEVPIANTSHGKLTFLDPMSSYLEVTLEVAASVAAEQSVMWYIQGTFVEAVRKAMKTLHYNMQVPNVSFLCPEQSSQCSIIPHPAIVDDTQCYLICPFSSAHFSLTEKQKMWLPKLKAAGKLLNYFCFTSWLSTTLTHRSALISGLVSMQLFSICCTVLLSIISQVRITSASQQAKLSQKTNI